MKSVSESMKEIESKKSHLQEQVDQLNEDCARLKAQGICACFTYNAAFIDVFISLLSSSSHLVFS